MSSCCLCFVFTCFDLLLSLLFHAQSHGYAHFLKKKLEFAIGTSTIIHLFCPPKCFVFSPRSIGTPVMPRRHQMIQKLCNIWRGGGRGGGLQTKCIIRVVQMANSRLFFGQTVSQFTCPGPLLAYLI